MSTAQPTTAIRCCLAQSELTEARLKLASSGASFQFGAADIFRSAMRLLTPSARRITHAAAACRLFTVFGWATEGVEER